MSDLVRLVIVGLVCVSLQLVTWRVVQLVFTRRH